MPLRLFNSLTRDLETFQPLHPPFVGVYVCGPTVYGDAHIGHAKSYISFDVVVRYLRFLGYKVRYVQNITDVGHLTDDADQGEDKVEKRAALERIHPMQLAELFTRRYFEDMDALAVLRPDISPRASGHIPEQIALTQLLLERGHAYVVDGTVYFDVASWPDYGKLSRRRLDEQEAGARVEVRGDKRHPADFALWKKAEPGHIMQWPSPWGMGYPGWHLECSVMSQKYLGTTFDIHGGGLENSFPHHEDEIAQSEAAYGQPFARYWLHNNMVTVGGQKMGKSLGNFVTLRDAFKKFDPMVLRMVILQGHYRSPFDYSEAALGAAQTAYTRLVRTVQDIRVLIPTLQEGPPSQEVAEKVARTEERFLDSMDSDFGTSGALAALFDLAGEANSLRNAVVHATPSSASAMARSSFEAIDQTFRRLGGQVLGLIKDEYPELAGAQQGYAGSLEASAVEFRNELKRKEAFSFSDLQREIAAKHGVIFRDAPTGSTVEFTPLGPAGPEEGQDKGKK